MKNTELVKPKILTLLLFVVIYSLSSIAFAAPFPELPGSVAPGRVSQDLTPPPEPPRSAPSITRPKEEKAKSTLGTAAERIKFKLTRIILEGNHVYSNQELEALYQNKLNRVISVAELQQIAQDITNHYRNNGYILSRAILPPQHVKDGIVKVRVIEGYIDKVRVIGCARGARCLVLAFGQRIASCKPLQIKNMEYYLRLANEIPGVQVRAILEPSKTAVGASDLNLQVDTRVYSAYLSYDNYGTRYMGPQQITVGSQAYSIFRSGDVTTLTYVTTPKPLQLKYIDINHETPLCDNGLRLLIGANDSKTQPGFVLAPLEMQGEAPTFYIVWRLPLCRERTENLSINWGWYYLDSSVSILNQNLYSDHLRPLRAGLQYDFVDKLNGANLWTLDASYGLDILGASDDPSSLHISRIGGHGANYLKFVGQMSRLQPFCERFSLFTTIRGQYSFNALLVPEQFGFGGSQLGRGYDPSEIIGDRGLAGSIELRMNFNPDLCYLKALQPYIFYDAGVVWNIKSIANTNTKLSATSTGVGSRFTFNPFLTGNVMIAQPLTKQVLAEQLIGQGRRPRIFFSITASI